MIDFFISNGLVLWTLMVIALPWIILGIVIFFIVRAIRKRLKRKKEASAQEKLQNAIDCLEAEIQMRNNEIEYVETKSNVIQFPGTSND